MSDTPETDAVDCDPINLNRNDINTYHRMTTHSRRLERERDEARAEAEKWRDRWMNGYSMSMVASTKLPWEENP